MKGSEADTAADAYSRAVNLLARRDHSAAELQRKLLARGYPLSVVVHVVDRLSAEGYLNDERFARNWTEAALRSGRGYGIRILQELQRRGISRETAAAAIETATAELTENDSLATIVSRRFSAFESANAPLKERLRVYSYLQRRGFSLRVIKEFFNKKTEESDR